MIVAWQVYAKEDAVNSRMQAWEFIQQYIATQIPTGQLPSLEYDEQRDEYFWNFNHPKWAVHLTNGLTFTELVEVIQ